MIKSELDEKQIACNIEMVGSITELSKELASIFDAFSKRSDTKMILLSVIDTYLGKELKGE